MNVSKIVAEWLRANGYDGLYCPHEPCGCEVDDLGPCGEICLDCEPGHRVEYGPHDECGCDGQGTKHWHIAPVIHDRKIQQAGRNNDER